VSNDKPMNDSTQEAAIIFASYLPDALRRAREYAGDAGFVASMPQLLHARASAPFDNEIWNTWFFTANSEESLAISRQGGRSAVFVHGGGIFATPERFRQLYMANVGRDGKDGYTGLFGAKILEKEAQDVLEGRLPDGTEIPVFSFDEIKRGVRNLPRRYAIVMDFELARSTPRGFSSFDELKENPVMIARAGGQEAAAVYLDKAREFYGTTQMGNWHRFDQMNPDQPQTYIQFLYDCVAGASGDVEAAMRTEGDSDSWFTHYRVSRDAGFGLRGDSAMINTARYVAVTPRRSSTCVRHLKFNTRS